MLIALYRKPLSLTTNAFPFRPSSRAHPGDLRLISFARCVNIQGRSDGMPNERYVFQEVTKLTAGAVGVPGQRTFYLVAGNEDTLVRVWLEKEQLLALSAAIQEVLADLKGREATQSGGPPGAPG